MSDDGTRYELWVTIHPTGQKRPYNPGPFTKAGVDSRIESLNKAGKHTFYSKAIASTVPIPPLVIEMQSRPDPHDARSTPDEPETIAHRAVPDTSALANDGVDKQGQYERIWRFVNNRGELGATSDYVDAHADIGATIASSRRFSEMRRLGMLRYARWENGNVRTTETRTGHQAKIHVAVPRDEWKPVPVVHTNGAKPATPETIAAGNELCRNVAGLLAIYGETGKVSDGAHAAIDRWLKATRQEMRELIEVP